MNHPVRLFAGDGRRLRRRLAVLIPALAAVAIALTPAGSASPPSSGIKQYTACLAQSATPATCGTFDTNSAGELQLRNLNLAIGSKVSVTFSVTTPCSGSGTWTVPAKQSNV